MAKTLSLDPVTRIEGHLSIETRVEGGKVTGAKVAGRMFRGFEQLLLGRHPVDAARITQRICGICHEVHGIAASIALEDLYGLPPTENGHVLRDLILGLHLATDHIFHFYQLTLPDYLDFSLLRNYHGRDERIAKLDRIIGSSPGTFGNQKIPDALSNAELTAEMALGYTEAITIRKTAGSGLASLGGKVPFCHAILPGGVTTGVSSDKLMNYVNALEQVTDFVNRLYLPQAKALANHFPHYFAVGRSHGNFYGNGGFTLLGEPLFTAGVLYNDGRAEPFRMNTIAELVDATFLDDKGGIRPDKDGAYSWVKALQYAGEPMEVGPLARVAVNRDAGFVSLLKQFNQTVLRSSVMGRILARAYEAQKICSHLEKILPRFALDQPTINPPDMLAKPDGTGRGMSLAARGALNHEVTARDGKVTGYRLQVPSAWNFGPTVNGRTGTVEQALLGTPVQPLKKKGDTANQSIETGRIVRSFDPCLACAIH